MVPNGKANTLASCIPIQGKALSYNNLVDADAALKSCVDLYDLGQKQSTDFSAVTIVKHANPCGQAIGSDAQKTLELAWRSDPVSAFGGIVCVSNVFSETMAKWISDYFVEIIIAKEFSPEAKAILAKKKNLRLIEYNFETYDRNQFNLKSIDGGAVIQENDKFVPEELKSVTEKEFKVQDEMLNQFAILSCKHLKSNAISLVAKVEDVYMLLGAGMGLSLIHI